MQDIRTFALKVGREKIADTVGRTRSAVDNAVRNGAFPAAWFVSLRALGKSLDIEVSEEMFGWHRTKDANATKLVQGQDGKKVNERLTDAPQDQGAA